MVWSEHTFFFEGGGWFNQTFEKYVEVKLP